LIDLTNETGAVHGQHCTIVYNDAGLTPAKVPQDHGGDVSLGAELPGSPPAFLARIRPVEEGHTSSRKQPQGAFWIEAPRTLILVVAHQAVQLTPNEGSDGIRLACRPFNLADSNTERDLLRSL